MLQLKEKHKTMSCKDMQQGDIAIVTFSGNNEKQNGMLILCGYQHYIDLSTGHYYGKISTDVHPISHPEHPSWTVKLIEPGTELIIK